MWGTMGELRKKGRRRGRGTVQREMYSVGGCHEEGREGKGGVW